MGDVSVTVVVFLRNNITRFSWQVLGTEGLFTTRCQLPVPAFPHLCEPQSGAHTLRRRRSGTPFWMLLGTRTTCPT